MILGFYQVEPLPPPVAYVTYTCACNSSDSSWFDRQSENAKAAQARWVKFIHGHDVHFRSLERGGKNGHGSVHRNPVLPVLRLCNERLASRRQPADVRRVRREVRRLRRAWR